jgi:cysteine desulfurase
MKTPVYLDYQATTPTDPRVVEAMAPYWFEKPGNPHSRTHAFGWEAEEAVEEARMNIAKVIGADPKEIVFTSGATESNNMALKGAAEFYGADKKHIITVVTEHKCVLDSCRQLSEQGFDITYLPVEKDGLLDLQKLEGAIREDTMMVSVMHANNEIGTIQDMKAIGAICRAQGVKLHSDCAQTFGKEPIDVNEMNIDVMSISSHKIYGPMGVGALFVRRKPRMRVRPIIHGGGQERGMRSGTLPTPLLVGFGKAAEIALAEMETENARLTQLRDKMLHTIQDAIPHVFLNGHETKRLSGNLNLSFAYVEGESLMMAIKDLAVSSGSACTSASLEPSYVLRALGLSDDMAHTSIRIGIGRFTTDEEVDFALETILANVEKLREMSPLWEMVQEGIDLSKIEWAEH